MSTVSCTVLISIQIRKKRWTLVTGSGKTYSKQCSQQSFRIFNKSYYYTTGASNTQGKQHKQGLVFSIYLQLAIVVFNSVL